VGVRSVGDCQVADGILTDYAPRNWKYRWILLDASLALIYLAAFAAISWLWRPVSYILSLGVPI
jgi:hypothetical protein